MSEPISHRVPLGAVGYRQPKREASTEAESPVRKVVVAAAIDERPECSDGREFVGRVGYSGERKEHLANLPGRVHERRGLSSVRNPAASSADSSAARLVRAGKRMQMSSARTGRQPRAPSSVLHGACSSSAVEIAAATSRLSTARSSSADSLSVIRSMPRTPTGGPLGAASSRWALSGTYSGWLPGSGWISCPKT